MMMRIIETLLLCWQVNDFPGGASS